VRRRDQRLIVILVAGAMLAVAAVLVFIGLSNSVAYFVAPSELAEKAQPGARLRLGGLVLEGSIVHETDGSIRFTVTDGAGEVEVVYAGIVPDLFKEGQGVVAEGLWAPGEPFRADRLLAKHDETYMPREVTEALKQRGEWRGDDEP
jgi:cytochrome c-type biogenesis protein CcmE